MTPQEIIEMAREIPGREKISPEEIRALKGLYLQAVVKKIGEEKFSPELWNSWEYVTDSGSYPASAKEAGKFSPCYLYEQEKSSFEELIHSLLAIRFSVPADLAGLINLSSCNQEAINTLITEKRQQAINVADWAENGRARSLSDLAKMFPEHVRAQEWYSESGDSGWAGGGPDAWGSGTDYCHRTEVGRLAIEYVTAGEKPRTAIELAIESETTRLEAEGKIKAEAEAIAKADRDAEEYLRKIEKEAFNRLHDLTRSLNDGKGRSPSCRRSSKTKKADFDEMNHIIEEIQKIQSPTKRFSDSRKETVLDLQELVEKHIPHIELAQKCESIIDSENPSKENIQYLLDSEFLWRSEREIWEKKLEKLEFKNRLKNEVKKEEQLGLDVWAALDNFKI